MSDPVLELAGVTKVFGNGDAAVRAVDHVDLVLQRGELVVVTGPSGSGKTTLLQLAGGLTTPTAGSVALEGRRYEDTSRKERARLRAERIGFVFQAYNLFPSLPAASNVRLPSALLPRRARHPERAATLLREVGLEDRREHLPGELSGGQQQRVAIARALVNDPALLLADEPTGNLDSRSGYAVIHLLERLARERMKTVLVVTHDLRISQVADRTLWLADGRWAPGPAEAAAVTDAVCGMEIVADRAAAIRTVDGRTFYFCSDICAEKFDRAPTAFDHARVAG